MRRFITIVAIGIVVNLGFMWVLGKIGVQFEFLNVFEKVFEDFDLTDYYYTNIRVDEIPERDAKGKPIPDKPPRIVNSAPFEDRIVLVNIGDKGRREIAQMIEILAAYQPKVMAVDIQFAPRPPDQIDPIANYMMQQAVSKVDQFVAACRVDSLNPKTKVWKYRYLPIAEITRHAEVGIVNTGTPDGVDFPLWREFPPKAVDANGDTTLFLALKTAALYSEEAKQRVEQLIKRNNDSEIIYYHGDDSKFPKLSPQNVLDTLFTPELIKGKIVLLGYMGVDYLNYHFDEDRFYTPLNADLLGTSTPDMYGVVVHANIISMILNDKTIIKMSSGFSILVALLICIINVTLFTYILMHRRLGIWYNITSKAIQLVEAIVVVILAIFLFSEFQYKANFNIAFLVILLSGDVTEIFVDIIARSIMRLISK